MADQLLLLLGMRIIPNKMILSIIDRRSSISKHPLAPSSAEPVWCLQQSAVSQLFKGLCKVDSQNNDRQDETDGGYCQRASWNDMKKAFRGQGFTNDEKNKKTTCTCLRKQRRSFYQVRIHSKGGISQLEKEGDDANDDTWNPKICSFLYALYSSIKCCIKKKKKALLSN